MSGRRPIVTAEILEEFERQFKDLSQRRAILACEHRRLVEDAGQLVPSPNEPDRPDMQAPLESMAKDLKTTKAKLEKVSKKLTKISVPDKRGIGASLHEV